MNPENKDIIGNNVENTETKKISNISNAPPCCAGCVRWEKFGKNCFYYWEGKKHCTMWISNWDEAVQPPL